MGDNISRYLLLPTPPINDQANILHLNPFKATRKGFDSVCEYALEGV